MSKGGNFIRKASSITGGPVLVRLRFMSTRDIRNPVTITCSKHGDFQKYPPIHLSKGQPARVCPK